MADLYQKCAKIIKFFSPQYSDIPKLDTKLEWRKAPIVNVIISCVQSYRQGTEWLECSAIKYFYYNEGVPHATITKL
jgi:hypothetical protein